MNVDCEHNTLIRLSENSGHHHPLPLPQTSLMIDDTLLLKAFDLKIFLQFVPLA